MNIEKVFTYHSPTPNQISRFQNIRIHAAALAEVIQNFTPQSREQSLALTAVQQAVMWANAAIAINEAEPTGANILPPGGGPVKSVDGN